MSRDTPDMNNTLLSVLKLIINALNEIVRLQKAQKLITNDKYKWQKIIDHF